MEKNLEPSPSPPNCSKDYWKLLPLLISINWPSLVTSWLVVKNIYSKIYLVSCTNTHCDDTDSVNHGMVKNTKTWISWEWNRTFLWNKKILNLCLRWHILRSYHFVVEVTFQITFWSTLAIPGHNQTYIKKLHWNFTGWDWKWSCLGKKKNKQAGRLNPFVISKNVQWYVKDKLHHFNYSLRYWSSGIPVTWLVSNILS